MYSKNRSTKFHRFKTPYIFDKDNKITSRYCSCCGTLQTIDNFGKDCTSKYGYSSFCKICKRLKALNFNKYKYKINYDIYNKMLIKQGNKCSICNLSFSDKKIKPHIDHNHTTGKVRGILCSKCNIGIGQLKENINILYNAIKYLEELK